MVAGRTHQRETGLRQPDFRRLDGTARSQRGNGEKTARFDGLHVISRMNRQDVFFRSRPGAYKLDLGLKVPVLSGYDQFIGTGTVGGYMYSIEQQARASARMGLRILHGEPVRAIPTLTENGNRFIFDHPALRRYGIPLSTLPPESIVISYRSPPVWSVGEKAPANP